MNGVMTERDENSEHGLQKTGEAVWGKTRHAIATAVGAAEGLEEQMAAAGRGIQRAQRTALRFVRASPFKAMGIAAVVGGAALTAVLLLRRRGE